MSKLKVQWVLRSAKGQVRGPFDTQVVLEMIREGHLNGEEMIARYPGGKWIPISREPEFYDHLLGALQQDTQTGIQERTRGSAPYSEDTITPPPAGEEPRVELTKTSEKLEVGPKPVFPAPAPPRSPPPPPTIELENLKRIRKKKKTKAAWRPLLGLVVVFCFAAIVIFWPQGKSGGKIRLQAPKKGDEKYSAEEVKMRTRQALADIQKDTAESYLDAQSKLVSLIEGSPRYLPGRALLCIVYKELWPYSYQDQQDQKTISEFSQATRNLNLIGIHGNICEAVKLMMLGKNREARGVVDNMLDNPDDLSFLSTVYLIKAELLTYDRDFINAQAFFKQAAEKGKDWLKTQSAWALMLLNNQRYSEADVIFQNILRANPNHKMAKIGYGLTLYNGYQKADESFQWLKSGLDMSALAPRELEADGFFALATLALQKGNKDLAKEAAEKAYERKPQSEAIKDLLFRMGGAEKFKMPGAQRNELVFLGDQYVRQGDCFAAQAQFKTAFEMDPQNGVAAMKAAKCLWQLHQASEAIAWLRKAVQADPKLIAAYVLQADYLSQRYDFMGATQILLAAKRASPDSYEVLRGFAQVEFRKNNLEGALAYGQKALASYQGDIETLILLSRTNLYLAKKTPPNSPKEVEKRETALKDAMKFALKALEIDGTHVEANKNYALIMGTTTGVEAGIRIIQELIKKYSFNFEYRVALADLLKGEQRYPQAQILYEQIVDADPKNKEAYLGLGECYQAQKETTKALKAYLSASALDPGDAQPIFSIGRLYLETQRFDESVKYFERVYKINPNFPRTHYYIGKAAYAAGVFSVAMDAIKQEKKNNPYLSDSYLLAGEILQAQKQYNECANEYAQAIKLRAQPAVTYVRAAQCYRLAGATEVAEDMLAIAASRESGFAEIYREQGAIFDTKGDRKASIKAYCLYLELSPNAPDKKDVDARLNHLGFKAENCNNK